MRQGVHGICVCECVWGGGEWVVGVRVCVWECGARVTPCVRWLLSSRVEGGGQCL